MSKSKAEIESDSTASYESAWILCADELPPDDEVVMTKIDDQKGVRNKQTLYRQGRLWWFPSGEMYVYYAPTHWKREDS